MFLEYHRRQRTFRVGVDDIDLTRRVGVEVRDDPKKRALAATAGADDTEKLTILDLEVDVV